tara:strand:- start:131 stop:613 length:483 start_codon:yes stop_codon:yes gene_type:complete
MLNKIMKNMGLINSINVSLGGVPKTPVNSVMVNFQKIQGDSQNFHFHGGIKRAVCLYSLELIDKLNLEGHQIFPGSTGENLTLEGIDWNQMKAGLKLIIGDAILQLTETAKPCKTIESSFLSGDFNRINESKFPGWSRWYASVIKEGFIQVGDSVSILIE